LRSARLEQIGLAIHLIGSGAHGRCDNSILEDDGQSPLEGGFLP
jgi:hypothetical protein